MKILAIGLGGAGSRIVDHLYDHDRRSNVNCVTPIAIDIGGSALQQLRFIPENSRINYSRMDPATQVNTRTTLDFEEIMTIIQKMDTVDIHAIIIFGGLGGELVDAIPILAKELRRSYVEPVFAVCTLPYLSEGKSCSAKAADDLEMIDASVDALILFDNETWYHKILASFKADKSENQTRGKKFLTQKNPDNPRDMYRLLNERIARQIGLLLRAGEFNEAGVETAEIVLDAGEVLNTLTGNGLTAIGYAIEALPHSWHDRLDKWRSKTYFTEGSHRRATRMVSLAKKAVYEDISIPCDLTSADKALVLIGGPSQELSMKGFQTVRKWIDKSIAGLEMRSGDYPVRNTKYVGIIIMLSGLHNIPRIEEIKKLRREYLAEKESEEKRIKEEKQRHEAELLLSREYADESSEQETAIKNDDNCLIEEVETFISEIRTGVATEEPDINAPDNPDLQESANNSHEITEDISEINRKVPESANNSHEINRNIPELSNNSPEINRKVPESTNNSHEITEDNSEIIKDFSEPTGRGNIPVTDRTGIIIADETTTGNDSATVSFIDLLEDETEEEEMNITSHDYNSSGSGQETYLDYSDENNPYTNENHTMTDKNHALTSKDYVVSEEIYGKSQQNIETKSLTDEMISIPYESDRENNRKSGSKNSSSKKLKDECIS
ncbi:MAG: hypothetical protein KAW93_04080, partial [Methanogenium sp.]|nr:hypothetical protein [Methanogenium sp.]